MNMDIIPVIHIKKRKISAKKGGKVLSLQELLDHIDTDKPLYILDEDGIEDDKPNLCSYPKLSEHCTIWVDAGPRVLGDVVDAVTAGAGNIIIRKEVWPTVEGSQIKEITENEIYSVLDLQAHDGYIADMSLVNDVDGLVVLEDTDQIKSDFKTGGFLRNLCAKHKIYLYVSSLMHKSHWEELGVAGLLIDLNKARGFKDYDI